MAELNKKENRLGIKLVYYGPALSGKTTNIMQLHDRINPSLKGEIMTLETRNDRTLFFDLLPLGFRASSGLLVKFKLFTVPGQVVHDGTRKAVLSRSDGVVFVADSQNTQGFNNTESFENLVANAARVGIDMDTLPLVVQFNKRDMQDIVSEEEIHDRWQGTEWPLYFSTAITGEGVVQTFCELLKQVYRSLNRKYRLMQDHGITETEFVAAVVK